MLRLWQPSALTAITLWLIACWSEPPNSGASQATVGVETWPADGSQAVAPNLAFIAFRFDSPQLPPGHIQLQDVTTDALIALSPMQSSCSAIGWATGTCALARPAETLQASHSYRMSWQTGHADLAVQTWGAVFHTQAANDTTPPRWQSASCARDEMNVAFGCVLVWDVGLETRVFLSEPSRLWQKCNGQQSSAVAHRAVASLALTGLPSGRQLPLELLAADAADNPRRVALEITTHADLPALSITKVMANPRGAEPQQEFIEIHNFGSKPIELLGFQIADDPDSEGDIIQQALALGPQRRALLVPADFDPAATADVTIPPGLPLIYLDDSLADGGLSNTGEPLFLRDNHGRRLSGAPPMAMSKAGVCMIRTSEDPRSDRTEHFSYEPMWECAPGAPLSANDD